MNDTIKVNGKTIPWLVVTEGFKIPSFNFEIERDSVPGRPGAVFKRRNLKEYSFELPLIVRNDYLSSGGLKTHDDIMEEITKLLNYKEPVKLQFASQDWYWNAYFEGPIEIEKTFYSFIEVSINVVLLDPYKYKEKGNENTAIQDQVSVVNSGTADTPIIVEARALKNSNYYMITKNDEDYFMIGDDDVDKPLKDYSPFIFNDELRSFNGWSKQITIDFTDNQTGGGVGGALGLSSSKDAFELKEDSVTGNGWQGGLYKKVFTKQATDFTTTVKFAVFQRKKGAAHFANYIYDSDNRVIASIGYSNPNANQATGRIIVTLFNQSGNQQVIYNYKNNPSLYKLDSFVVYIKLTRKGNEFTVKSWKYREIPYPKRKIAFDTHEKTFVDRGNFYLRPVVSNSLYLAKNGTHQFMPVRPYGVYTRELLPRPVGARDMIIKKGDEITIDMATKNVLVNEEPFLTEKTFGSDFFNVESGYSELLVYPTGVFDTTIQWQDRYL